MSERLLDDSIEDSEAYSLGYEDACEHTKSILAGAMEMAEGFRKLNQRYYAEIKRLRAQLGLPVHPILSEEGAP